MQKSLRQEYFERYKKAFMKCNIIGFIVLAVFVFPQYFTTSSFGLIGFATNFVCMYPYYMIFALISFVISFQIFIIESLQEFRYDLKRESSLPKFSIVKFSMKFQDIYELVEKFRMCFGLSLTLVTCHLILVLIFTVHFQNDNINHTFLMFFFNFSAFQLHSMCS